MSKKNIDKIMTDARNARNAKKRQQDAETAKAAPAPEPAPQTPADAPTGEKKAKTPAKKNAAKTEKKMSGLDAVAKVLAEAGAPMNTRAMVETAAAKGYWASKAKTPWATIYAAILREMDKKGTQARFKKTDRGLFSIA